MKNDSRMKHYLVKPFSMISLAATLTLTSQSAYSTIEDDVAQLQTDVANLEQQVSSTTFTIQTMIFYVNSLLSNIIDPHIAPDAAVVHLMKDCTDADGNTMDNCFEDTVDLTDWIAQTRLPDAAAPLEVRIGPGTFEEFVIPSSANACNISIIGSGRQQTTITNSINGMPTAFMFPDHCILSVSDLRITNSFQWSIQVTSGNGIRGESTWTDIDLFANDYGWQDNGCNAKHSWFNSRIIAKPLAIAGSGLATFARAYETCGEDWFYGSEITAHINQAGNPSASGNSAGDMHIIKAEGNAEVHVYGSIIRAIVDPGFTVDPPSIFVGTIAGGAAIKAMDNSDIHIHASAIDVLSTEDNDMAVIFTRDNAHVHANETSYNLRTGSNGTITRINNQGGHVRAPAAWEASDTLPAVVSVTGQDTGMLTTNTSDGRPHPIVYDSSCASNWYDLSDQACAN